jgi:hypothetical protein
MVVKPGSAAVGAAEERVTGVVAHPGNAAKREKPRMAAQLENRRDFTNSPQRLRKK